MWPHSLKVAQLLRSAACLHTNQSRSYLNHLVYSVADVLCLHFVLNVRLFRTLIIIIIIVIVIVIVADLRDRMLSGVGLRPVASWDCGFASRRGHGCLSVVSVVCCQVEVSASGRSLVQRSPTECGVSERNRESSIMRRPWHTGVVHPSIIVIITIIIIIIIIITSLRPVECSASP